MSITPDIIFFRHFPLGPRGQENGGICRRNDLQPVAARRRQSCPCPSIGIQSRIEGFSCFSFQGLHRLSTKGCFQSIMEEVQRLLHEIEVRQSELEQENESLRATQRHLEAYRDRYVDLYDFAPLGYVTLDEDGYVQEINLAGAKLLDADREGLTGYAFSDHVAEESREAFLGSSWRSACENAARSHPSCTC